MKSLPGNLLGEISLCCNGIQQIRTLSASEMSGFLPLDCARVKLAQMLIKTCRHLEWDPQKPVTLPASLSQGTSALSGAQFPALSILHLGEGRTSFSLLGSPEGGGG